MSDESQDSEIDVPPIWLNIDLVFGFLNIVIGIYFWRKLQDQLMLSKYTAKQHPDKASQMSAFIFSIKMAIGSMILSLLFSVAEIMSLINVMISNLSFQTLGCSESSRSSCTYCQIVHRSTKICGFLRAGFHYVIFLQTLRANFQESSVGMNQKTTTIVQTGFIILSVFICIFIAVFDSEQLYKVKSSQIYICFGYLTDSTRPVLIGFGIILSLLLCYILWCFLRKSFQLMSQAEENDKQFFEKQLNKVLDEYQQYFEKFEFRSRQNTLTNTNINYNFNSSAATDIAHAHVNDNANISIEQINNRKDLLKEAEKLDQLAAPSIQMCRLVVIMIRHTALLIFYLVFEFIKALLLRSIPGTNINLGNLSHIISNFIIYMLYPVGTTVQTIVCSFFTQKIFFLWYDKYCEKRNCMLANVKQKGNQLKHSDKKIDLKTSSDRLQLETRQESYLDTKPLTYVTADLDKDAENDVNQIDFTLTSDLLDEIDHPKSCKLPKSAESCDSSLIV